MLSADLAGPPQRVIEETTQAPELPSEADALPLVVASLATPRSTRASIALETLTLDRVIELQSVSQRWSDSTLKKHCWVEPMYSGFCSNIDQEPWPLDGPTAAAFIRWLGMDVEYAISSIEDVILPSLKRMTEERTGEAPIQLVNDHLSQALKDLKNKRKDLLTSQGKDAAIIDDVIHIIASTPDGHPTKAEEASCWLAAVYTGARAITVAHVLLKDISYVHREESGLVIVQIQYRVTKGNAHWNQIVSLEGHLTKRSDHDPIFWLSTHLRETFGLDLDKLSSWRGSGVDLTAKLWRWNEMAVSMTFKSRSISSGFPKGLHSFHSLRAGFICSALLKAGSSKESVAAVLETTAFVAGWAPGQRAQMRYVKATVRKTIVGNRMVMPIDEDLPVVERSLGTSMAFHALETEPVPTWPIETNYRSFHDRMDRTIKEGLNGAEDDRLVDRCWREAYSEFVLGRPDLEGIARIEYSQCDGWLSSRTKMATEKTVRMKVGRQCIADELNKDYGLLESFLKQFTDLISPVKGRGMIQQHAFNGVKG
jgi:hypothetical protein